jgi:AcrR family transcriptional regulator
MRTPDNVPDDTPDDPDETAELPTRERLIRAAALEFNEKGFHGTDTNRIARRAGFAPQTFYRQFKDKTDVFLAAYEAWMRDEYRAIDALVGREDFDLAVADIILAHHRTWPRFPRTLDLLASEDERVRRARRELMVWKIARLRHVPENATRPDADLAADLLAIQRLGDAVADGELDDIVAAQDIRSALARAVARACGRG